MKTRNIKSALKVLRQHGGTLRTRDALAQGIHPAALYSLRDRGVIVEEVRGLYRLADAPWPENPELFYVAAKAPNAVVCLVSDLSFHHITTQIPHTVQLAVPRGAYHRISLSPTRVEVFRFDAKSFEHGIETHTISGKPVRVYSVARTLADIFKYCNKIGMDVALEALEFARERTRVGPSDIWPAAQLLRQEKVMEPYLRSTYHR